jgi:hypothetical protein
LFEDDGFGVEKEMREVHVGFVLVSDVGFIDDEFVDEPHFGFYSFKTDG